MQESVLWTSSGVLFISWPSPTTKVTPEVPTCALAVGITMQWVWVRIVHSRLTAAAATWVPGVWGARLCIPGHPRTPEGGVSRLSLTGRLTTWWSPLGLRSPCPWLPPPKHGWDKTQGFFWWHWRASFTLQGCPPQPLLEASSLWDVK